MVKRKIRMGTINGHFLGEFEAEVQTEEEKENAKDNILIPLRHHICSIQCHYCGNEFYLINPIRAPNVNPSSDGFICIYDDKYKNYYYNDKSDKELGRLIPACRSCFKEMADQHEPISIKPWLVR